MNPCPTETAGLARAVSQVRTFHDCQARWWFKYGLQLPERKTSSLALGLAIHRALELNFREKLETHEDLDTSGVVMIFRDAWMEQAGQTDFTADESQQEIRRACEQRVAKYMDEVAPKIEPAAVELDVQGLIAGVPVRGRVDLLDTEGRLIDIKTASCRPSWVSPDYAFQLATYRQITPGPSGEARIDCLVKNKYSADRPAKLYSWRSRPACDTSALPTRSGGNGIGNVLPEPTVNAVQ